MVGTNEDAIVRKRDREYLAGELSDFDRKIIGKAVRIEIPFTSVYNMRRIADLLRGYASVLDLYSRNTDLPPRSILNHLKMEAKGINARIKNMTEEHRSNHDEQ